MMYNRIPFSDVAAGEIDGIYPISGDVTHALQSSKRVPTSPPSGMPHHTDIFSDGICSNTVFPIVRYNLIE